MRHSSSLRPALVAVLVSVAAACSSGSAARGGSDGVQGTGGGSGQAGTAGASTAGRSDTDGSAGHAGTPGSGGIAAGGTAGAGVSGGSGGTGGSVGGSRDSAGQAGAGGRAGWGGAGTAGSVAGGAGQAGHAGSVAGTGGSSAGASGAGGATGGGAGAGGTGPMRSAGCGKTPTLQNGAITITFNGASRKYILRVPEVYDNEHPHRLILAYAWSGGSATDVVNSKYFTFASLDSTGTIFAAPDAADGAGTWSNGDVALTDAILAQLEDDLCIDQTRVFATGFSFGGAMAMALGCTRADVFRAVAFFSGADLTNSCPTTLTKPIAYFATQASEDSGGLSSTSPITGEKRQADFAAVNGCKAEPASTTFPSSGEPHHCTNYSGCSAGHPTEYCVFNGAHGWEPKDPGQATSWAAPEAWKFISQF